MRQYNRRKEQMVEALKPFMSELFSNSCMELQKIFEKIGHQEWDRFEKVLKEVLAIGKRMQEEEDKGKIHYVIFSFLQYGSRNRRFEIRIDLLDQGFYLDERECSCQTADYLGRFPQIISDGNTCHSLRSMRQKHIISGVTADYRGLISVQLWLD